MLDALNRFFISLLIVSQQSAGLYKLILDIFASVHNADILRETALLLSLFVYAFMQWIKPRGKWHNQNETSGFQIENRNPPERRSG